jgi:UPF0755 protein
MQETVDFYLPSGTDLDGVLDLLEQKDLIIDRSTLEWLAKRKITTITVRPGRYRLRDGMSNNQLVNMLRSGNQVPVNLIFINQRTIEDIASVVSRQIEADSSDISQACQK